MNKKILQTIILSPAILVFTYFPFAVSANPLENDLLGYGCIVKNGNYASDVITISNTDIVKAHGVLAPNTTITHVVNLSYDFGVSDTSCLAAKANINLEAVSLPATSEISFDSLILDGALNNASIINNSGLLTLTLRMTTQAPISMATPFTYSIPFTINANVTTP